MLTSIRELTTVRPHVHDSARYSAVEFETYREGYYAGVVAAMKVAELAVKRFQLGTRTRRAAGKRKASA